MTGSKDGDGLRPGSKEALRWAQDLVRRHTPPGVSLVDELIAERRAEAAREEAETRDALRREERSKSGQPQGED